MTATDALALVEPAQVLIHPRAADVLADELRRHVIYARMAGLSWREIAAGLGCSKTGAYERFKRSDPLRGRLFVRFDEDEDGRFMSAGTPLLDHCVSMDQLERITPAVFASDVAHLVEAARLGRLGRGVGVPSQRRPGAAS